MASVFLSIPAKSLSHLASADFSLDATTFCPLQHNESRGHSLVPLLMIGAVSWTGLEDFMH